MSFRAVLVDQARPIRRTRGTRNTQGESAIVVTYGSWVKARLVPAGSVESRSTRSAAHDVKSTQLLYGKDMLLGPDDRVEVASVQLGTGVWTVVGQPQPIRKKRSLIGYQATIRQVTDI